MALERKKKEVIRGMKRTITLSIDSEIHKRAKDKFYNLSGTIERLLREALNVKQEEKEKICTKCGNIGKYFTDEYGWLCKVHERILMKR
jgi:post-segregation antitoxin (ccd killing protein)